MSQRIVKMVIGRLITDEQFRAYGTRYASSRKRRRPMRPVLITVAATVIALFPLAAHGGPLWEPLCYAQIAGLTLATFVTLLLVPVLYATAVLDLKVVRWDTR